MATPITSVTIHPSFGEEMCTVAWSVNPRVITTGDVYVYYSVTGITGSWQALNALAPVDVSVGFYNAVFNLKDGVSIGYYRIMIDTGAMKYGSDPVSRLSHLSHRDYGYVRKCIRKEFFLMRTRNGYPMWHLIPRDFGEYGDHYDPTTGDSLGLDCPDAPDEDKTYGTPYKGGYFTPVLVWIRDLRVDINYVRDRADELGTTDVPIKVVRLMSFPQPKRGHVLVNPYTDDRWLIGEKIETYQFRGSTSIAHEAPISLLPRHDVVYDFEVPALTLDPISGWPTQGYHPNFPSLEQYRMENR